MGEPIVEFESEKKELFECLKGWQERLFFNIGL